MTRSIRRKVTLIGVGAAGVIVTLSVAFGSTVAFAQDATPSPSTSAAQPGPAPGHGFDQADRARHHDELASALAKELGLDKEKVATALAKVEADRAANRPKPGDQPSNATKPDRTAELKSRLAAAVSAGTLTQVEADAILKAAQAGVLPGGGPPPGR